MRSQITDRIWIGASSDRNIAPFGEIRAVLNCAHDLADIHHLDKPRSESVGLLGDHLIGHTCLIDGPGNPLSAYYSAVFQLDTILKHGRTVLVHCHKGESRSVSVVIMYLHAKDAENRGWDFWRDFVRIKRTIPDDKPHPAHKEAFDAMDWEFVNKVIT